MSETKIAVVVRDDLALWQKLNVVVFLASGIVAAHRELIGAPYEDAAGNRYHPMFRTGHDAANRGAVRQYAPDEMNMVDLAVREEKRLVDKITRGPNLHA
jgi:hypothetical protein